MDPAALVKRIDPLLACIVVLACVLRIQGIDDDGFWLDETTSLHDAARPVGEILLGKGKPGHPPLYYLLLKGWTSLFGVSETAVRLLSALLGTAAVGATFALFRALHGRASGLAAALLLALSFHHIVFSQEARNYALLGLLAVATAHALWRALEEGGRRRWATYVGCAIVMAYAHHQAYVVLFAGAAGAVLAATVGRLRKGALLGLLLADLAIVAAAVPSIVLYMLGGGGRGYGYWQPHVTWQGLVDVAAVWTPGVPLLLPNAFLYGPHPPDVPSAPWLGGALLLPAAFLALAWRRAPSPRPLFHVGMLYAGLLAFVVIALVKPIWHVRYVFVFLPFFLGGLGGLVAALEGRAARIATVAILAALSIPGLVREKQVPGRTPWRETAAFVSKRAPGAAGIFLIGPSGLARPFGWYCKRRFEVVPGVRELVAAVRRAAEGGSPVLVVYCNAHGPPDPRHMGARTLAQSLELRGAARFGPLVVYEFAKRP